MDQFNTQCKPDASLSYAYGTQIQLNNGVRFHNEMQSGNCHDGQMKPTLGLLEFLQNVVDSYTDAPMQKMHLLYVGASSVAADAARIAFPLIRQTIYDPAPNMLQLMPQAYRKVSEVYKDETSIHESSKDFIAVKNFFTDASCGNFIEKRWNKGELILFVSDIRVSANDESVIVEDMLNQQKWAMELACDWYMFKFRPPYGNKTHSIEKIIHMYKPGSTDKQDALQIPYLKGDLMIQPYAPVGSGELRLIGRKQNDNFEFQEYNLKHIEDLSFAHNYFWRGHAMFNLSKSNDIVAPYDLAVEKDIISRLRNSKEIQAEINTYRHGKGKQTAADCALIEKDQRRIVGPLGRLIKDTCNSRNPRNIQQQRLPTNNNKKAYVPPHKRTGGGAGSSVLPSVMAGAVLCLVTLASSFVPR
jgi:hypothetical protein